MAGRVFPPCGLKAAPHSEARRDVLEEGRTLDSLSEDRITTIVEFLISQNSGVFERLEDTRALELTSRRLRDLMRTESVITTLCHKYAPNILSLAPTERTQKWVEWRKDWMRGTNVKQEICARRSFCMSSGKHEPTALALLNDGRPITAHAFPRTVTIATAESGAAPITLPFYVEPNQIVILKDDWIAFGIILTDACKTQKGYALVWDLTKPDKARHVLKHDAPIDALLPLSHGRIASKSQETIYVWDYTTETLLNSTRQTKEATLLATLGEQSILFVTPSHDKKRWQVVSSWDWTPGNTEGIQTLCRFESLGRCDMPIIAPDNYTIVGCTGGGKICISDLNTQTQRSICSENKWHHVISLAPLLGRHIASLGKILEDPKGTTEILIWDPEATAPPRALRTNDYGYAHYLRHPQLTSSPDKTKLAFYMANNGPIVETVNFNISFDQFLTQVTAIATLYDNPDPDIRMEALDQFKQLPGKVRAEINTEMKSLDSINPELNNTPAAIRNWVAKQRKALDRRAEKAVE